MRSPIVVEAAFASAIHFLDPGHRSSSGTAGAELRNEFECLAAILPVETILAIEALHKQRNVHI
jgi:hypothetical protein